MIGRSRLCDTGENVKSDGNLAELLRSHGRPVMKVQRLVCGGSIAFGRWSAFGISHGSLRFEALDGEAPTRIELVCEALQASA